jgi:tetratricopeptide (TPR) repeat protein
LALLAAALYWTIRLSRADWLFRTGNPQFIQQAIRLAPGNPDYYSGWAQREPERAVDILEKGVALNPIHSSLRIELGLAAEEKGDFRKAEASLLEAMRLDTSFAPRWALSDFYLHRRDAEKFWPVVKAALAISYGDVSAQFRNCWALSSDPQTILERAIPDRVGVLRQYLGFLLNEGRIDAAEPVASRVLARADKDAVDVLLNYCDRLLEAGRSKQALTVWNGLSERKLIPYGPLTPGEGEAPVNGDFRLPGLGAGFDWRPSFPDGIDMDRAGNPPALMLSFSGKQPENAEILSQYVPLLPRRQYVLSVRYRVSGIDAESGLVCYLLAANGKDLLNGQGLLPGGKDGDSEQEVRFQTPENTTLARLVFGYHRMLGTMRIEGALTLRKFALSLSSGFMCYLPAGNGKTPRWYGWFSDTAERCEWRAL